MTFPDSASTAKVDLHEREFGNMSPVVGIVGSFGTDRPGVAVQGFG